MSWTALVPDADGAIAKAIAEIISATADAPPATADDLADRALLRGYCEAIVPDTDDAGGAAISAALEMLDPSRPGLYGGAARLGWTVAHLVADEDAEPACAAIDVAITRQLTADHVPFDLISGVTGIGVYALERNSEQLVELVLAQLERLARPRGSGLAWKTPGEHLPPWQREQAPEGHWDLGVAHGTPGVIALLARFATRGMERARALLDGAVRFLLDAEPRTTAGRFPSWHLDGARTTGTPRVAWCYGDLGVAIALVAAARARDRADWYQEAILLARACAERPLEVSEVRDAGLCHGAAGAAHLFHRLHRATNDATFADAARTWATHTLALRNREPYAGFPAADGGGEDLVWSPDASLLTGAPGVALALAALISDVEPAWDRLLLVDI